MSLSREWGDIPHNPTNISDSIVDVRDYRFPDEPVWRDRVPDEDDIREEIPAEGWEFLALPPEPVGESDLAELLRPAGPDGPLGARGWFRQILDEIAGAEGAIASLHASRARLIDEARQCTETLAFAGIARGDTDGRPAGPVWPERMAARKVLVSEVGCLLRLPERTAETLIAHSEALVHQLPGTLAALRAGEISYRHATTLADQAGSLPEAARTGFEDAVLPAAKTLTVSKFERKARLQWEKAHPESIQERHQVSILDREVYFQPDKDGMAWLSAFLPAADALAAYNRLTDTALTLKDTSDPRTQAQIKADIFTDLLIEGVTAAGVGTGITATVQVTVPVLTLLGTSSGEPAQLEGYGPIDPETARRLAGTATSCTRLLTHPETGAVLSVGKDQYRVPRDLRTYLEIRDGTCRFPGCNRRAVKSEIDHTLDFQYGGATDHLNLAHLCKGHHRLKHLTNWQIKQSRGDGTVNWTAPSGHTYSTEPATRIRPAPPPDATPPDRPAPPVFLPTDPPF